MRTGRLRWRRYAAAGIFGGAVLAGTLLVLGGDSAEDRPAAARMKGATDGDDGARIRLPGALPFPPDLERQLLAEVEAKGPGYKPRTRHLNPDGSPKYVNRLIREKSPYLLQHAHNPVNWYPWCEEAFERARSEGKPILLSVGYSTCHWCHVMEEESFEDEEIARYLNEHYVSIKVDRERRPDVDAVYMAAVQSLTGRGGWPMTVWLTPDRKPFYGGTYFPPRDGDHGSGVGFLTLLTRLSAIYESEPERVAASAEEITRHIQKALAPVPSPVSDEKLSAAADQAFAQLGKSFDEHHGGFGDAPKFPRSVTLEFLLRYHRRTGTERAIETATKTLEAMAGGGMYDHVAGGFHRYSTDARWLVPHFEKMIYDNALLTIAYLEAYQATRQEDFARLAREILRYVSREMTTPEGGFHSATDADSEGEEGKFFVWTPQQIEKILGPERAKRFNAYYGVTEQGNFEHGTSILHTAAPLEEVAERFDMRSEVLRSEIETAREEIYEARKRRVPPLKDEKILVSWNGLMISAFARAAHVLGETGYAERAAKAANFILVNLHDKGRLKRSWFDGRAEGTGYLDDYAFLAQGLLDLYEATFEPRWLREAIALHAVLEKRFLDQENGGYFMTPDDAESLLAREKPEYDGAEPSGNSVAILNELRLEALTTEDRYRALAVKSLAAFGSILEHNPTAVPKMLAAVEFWLDTPKEIIIVKPSPDASAEHMLDRLRQTYLPNRVLSVAAEGQDIERQKKLIPLLEGRTAIRGKVTAYVCEKRVCELPTSDADVFARQIASRKPRVVPP